MSTPTLTPNIQLQVPGFNQPNWNVPIVYDLNRLDLLFGGSIQIPSLNVLNLTVQNFDVANFAAALVASCVQQSPSGSFPGNTYTLTRAPLLIMGLYYNGQFLIPGVNYTYLGNVITLNFTTSAADTLYVVYF